MQDAGESIMDVYHAFLNATSWQNNPWTLIKNVFWKEIPNLQNNKFLMTHRV